MNILRCCQGLDPVNISDIVDEPKRDLKIIYNIYSEITSICKRYKRERPSFKNFHLTTKTGPNGHALSAVWADYYATEQFVDNMKTLAGDEIKDRFITFGELMNGKVGKILREAYKIIPDKGNLIPGKVVSIPAPEGKTRTIGQLGY